MDIVEEYNLTDKQEAFAQEYTVDRNATQSAIRAGYSSNNAATIGNKLLKHPAVKARINELFSDIYERNKMGIDEAISILTDIARTEPADMLDQEGVMHQNVRDIPKYARHAIESIKFKTVYQWCDIMGENVAVSVPAEIKMTGKQTAIDKVLRHLGGFDKDNKQKKQEVTVLNLNPLTDYEDNPEEDLS